MSDHAADAGHAAGDDAHAHPEVNYIAKFWWLLGLTITEVVLAVGGFLPMGVTVLLLTALSIWKAGIVLNYFMHLKMENCALKLALAFPLALVVILVVLFCLDGVWLERSFAG